MPSYEELMRQILIVKIIQIDPTVKMLCKDGGCFKSCRLRFDLGGLTKDFRRKFEAEGDERDMFTACDAINIYVEKLSEHVRKTGECSQLDFQMQLVAKC